MKTRFLLGVLLLFSITMQGQQVKVNYENITNSLPIILQEYFRMQGVQHLNLTIKGEFNGKRAKLKKISIIRKSKFPQNPKRSVRFSGKRTKRSVQKRKARNTQKAETKVL